MFARVTPGSQHPANSTWGVLINGCVFASDGVGAPVGQLEGDPMSAEPTAMHCRPRQRRRLVLSVVVACVTAFSAEAVPAMAAPLPDGRGYEMVTPVDKNGIETGPGIGSVNGNAVNWESIGGCCGATSSAATL